MPELTFDEIYSLCHHGIKGQKWGVRRFQNEDGTLTDAGKARYNEKGEPYKDPRNMTDKQLAEANKRLGAESQYKQLTGTTQPGKAFNRDTAIKIGATFIAVAAATLLIRKYKNGTFLETTHIKGGQAVKGVKGYTKPKDVASVGKTVATAALAGGIGALMIGATSLGGSAQPMSKKEDK